MTLEGILDMLHVDPDDEDSPQLVWFWLGNPELEQEKRREAGRHTYVHLQKIGERSQGEFLNPLDGRPNSLSILATLYTPPVGGKPPASDAEIRKLYKWLQLIAPYVNDSGDPNTPLEKFYTYDQKPPAYDEKRLGYYARVFYRQLHILV
jgi:hypothetical protein